MNGLAHLINANPPVGSKTPPFTSKTTHLVQTRNSSVFATLPLVRSAKKTDINDDDGNNQPRSRSHFRKRSMSHALPRRPMKTSKPLPVPANKSQSRKKHRPPPLPPSHKTPPVSNLHPIQFDMHRQRSLPPQLERKLGNIDQSPTLKPHLSTRKNKPAKALPPRLKDHRSAPPPDTNKNKKPVSETKPPVVAVPPLTDLHNADDDHKSDAHSRDYSIVKSLPSLFHANILNGTSPNGDASTNKNTRKYGLLSPKGSHQGFATVHDTRAPLIQGQCQCGGVRYELLALPQELQHCYCSMCRKMHGAASATWTPLLEGDIRFIAQGTQTKYQSSENVVRSFCSVCGSNISLKYKFQADTIWMTPALFAHASDSAQQWWEHARVLHIFCGSKCEWYQLPNDGNPKLSETDILNNEIDGQPVFLYNKKLPPKKPLMHSH